MESINSYSIKLYDFICLSSSQMIINIEQQFKAVPYVFKYLPALPYQAVKNC